MAKQIASSILFLFFVIVINAQSKEPFPFWNEVQKFKTADSVSFPASNQILLIGSSSFTLWKDVQTYFPDRKILNRAFGGSTIADVIRYRYLLWRKRFCFKRYCNGRNGGKSFRYTIHLHPCKI
jgi:hypothetical protein